MNFRAYVVDFLTSENFLSTLFVVLAAGATEILIQIFKVPNYVIVPPSRVLMEIPGSLPGLLQSSWVTIQGVIIALPIGFTLAVLTGIMFHWSPLFKKATYKVAGLVNAIPIPALAPIIVVLVHSNLLIKIIAGSITVYFPIACHTYRGLRSVDAIKEKKMSLMNASKLQRLLYLELPHASYQILTALETTVKVILVGIFIAEWIGGYEGLGFYISNANHMLDLSGIIIGIIAIAIISIMFSSLISAATNWYLGKWHPAFSERNGGGYPH